MNTPDTITIPIARAYLWPDTKQIWFFWTVDWIPLHSIPVYRQIDANVPGNSRFIGLIKITAGLVQKVLWDELRMANVAQQIHWSLNIFKQEILSLISSNADVSNKLFNNPEVEAEIERQFKILRAVNELFLFKFEWVEDPLLKPFETE